MTPAQAEALRRTAARGGRALLRLLRAIGRTAFRLAVALARVALRVALRVPGAIFRAALHVLGRHPAATLISVAITLAFGGAFLRASLNLTTRGIARAEHWAGSLLPGEPHAPIPILKPHKLTARAAGAKHIEGEPR